MNVALIDDARLLGDLIAAQLVKLGHHVERVAPGRVFRALVVRRVRWSACLVVVGSARVAPMLRLLRCIDRNAPVIAVVAKDQVPLLAASVAAAHVTFLHPPVERDALQAALASAADPRQTGKGSDRIGSGTIRWHRQARPTEPPPDRGGEERH